MFKIQITLIGRRLEMEFLERLFLCWMIISGLCIILTCCTIVGAPVYGIVKAIANEGAAAVCGVIAGAIGGYHLVQFMFDLAVGYKIEVIAFWVGMAYPLWGTALIFGTVSLGKRIIR